MTLEENLNDLKIETGQRKPRKSRGGSQERLTLTALLNYCVGVIEMVAGGWFYYLAYRAEPVAILESNANLAVAELYIVGIAVMIRGLILVVAGLGMAYGHVWASILTVVMALLSIGAGVKAYGETHELITFLPILYGVLALVGVTYESRRFLD